MKKKIKKIDDDKVNVYDDDLMIELGLRCPKFIPRDESLWTKTEKEKKILKKERCRHKGKMHFHSIPYKSIPVEAKLIVYLKKNNIFPRTTYSTKCLQSDINNILSKYYVQNSKDKREECLIVKYKYNDIEYRPDERPVWTNLSV